MCQPTPCRLCGKTTWKGCGDHIESVRVQVPADQWCPGHDGADVEAEAAPAERKGWFGRG